MKIYLKFILLILCLGIFVVPFTKSASAAETVYATYWSMGSYTYSFGAGSGLPYPFDFAGAGNYYGFAADGNVAYCVDRTSQIPGGSQINMGGDWDGFAASTKRNVSLVLLYGFDGSTKYGFSEDTERVGTQMALWSATHGLLGSGYESAFRERGITGYYRGDVLCVYDRIISQLKLHSIIPSFAANAGDEVKVVVAGYDAQAKLHTVTLTDTNEVVSYYNLVQVLQNMGYSVTVNGNSITVTSTEPFDDSRVISTVRTSNTDINSLLIRDISYIAGTNVQAKVMVTGERHAASEVQAFFKLRSEIGSITIRKLDANTKSLVAGAVFEVFDSNGNSRGTMTTDMNGLATIDGLVYGKYTVVEKEPAFGYQSNEKVYEVTLNTETATIDIENEYMLGRVKLTKTSSFDGKILPNATYGLYNAKDNSLMEELTTDDKGLAVSEFVRYGKYYLKELKSPERYQIDINRYTVILGEEHGSTIDLPVKDAPIIGKLSLTYVPVSNPKIYVGDTINSPNTGVDYDVSEDMILGYPDPLATSESQKTNTVNIAIEPIIPTSEYMKSSINGSETIPWYTMVAIILIPILALVIAAIVIGKYLRRRVFYI